MRAPSTPATTARRSRPQRGGNEPGQACWAVARVRSPQREYQPRRCRRHQRSHGVVGIATTLRDAPDKSPDERGRTTAGPPRCGVDAVEPRADVMAARRSARGAGVNRPRGRELNAVPRARAGAGHLVEQRARVVEMGGIEPPSDGGATGLLRVQSAHEFLSPGISRGQGHRRAQLPACSKAPDSEGPQQWLPG